YATGSENAGTTSGRVIRGAALKGVVWVFSGHGAQWPNMGQQLLLNSVFRNKLSELDLVFRREADFSSIEALQQGELGGSDKIQILTYAVHVGLASLLQAEGITPQAVLGHSVGEISAAVVAGCLTSEEGAVIVARRANLYTQVQGRGAMALVALPFEEVAADLGGRRDIVAAVKSSPSTCVVSGTRREVGAYVHQLEDRGIETWRVNTDIAFHSPVLEKLLAPLRDSLQDALHPRPATLPIYSTSHPDPRTEALRDVRYWTHNTKAPVRFTDAVDAAAEDGFRVFLEVSTHTIVSHSVEETLKAQSLSECASFGVMSRNASSDRTIAKAVSQLYALGASVNFRSQLGDGPWSDRLPNTPWIHKPYWKMPPFGLRPAVQQHHVEKHTLLGGLVEIAGTDTSVWTTILDESTKPYPSTHRLGTTEIVPAAVYCNSLRGVAGAHHITDLQLRVPISITAESRELQVVLQGDAVQISSRVHVCKEASGDGSDGGDGRKHAWVEHSTARLARSGTAPYQHRHSIAAIRQRIPSLLSSSFAKEHLSSVGVSGMAFPWCIREHLGGHEEMLVQVDMPGDTNTLSGDAQSWAPLIDAATSISSCILSKNTTMYIVSGIDKVVFVSQGTPPKTGYLLIERRPEEKPQRVDVEILDIDGTRLCRLEGMQFTDLGV
ncbi:hypothetical protein J4E82_011709, partial [Alternaria postmessia]|uniref:uncharacterized protein n=1 Tax=Alternaria postmessia TaxID=1187938 RepID=UPI002225AA10